jgi:hypothetical protein
MNTKAVRRRVDGIDWRSLGRRATFQRRSVVSRPWFWTAAAALASAVIVATIALKRRRDDAACLDEADEVDEASLESFPASDAPSFNPSGA